MKSLWDEQDAKRFAGDDLAVRVYTSRLLGADEDLVMHGGGNTSVKGSYRDFFGREVDALFVKGSGWDLKTIEKPGFSPLRLEETRMLANLEALSDLDMAAQLRAFLLDPSAPSPSVEAILHAIMPAKFVDHTHADAVVTLSNNPSGEGIIRSVFPDCVVLPYVMPGFILSKQVFHAIKDAELSETRGIILLHHGVFTYSDDAREAYENMIELVSRAEAYIDENGTTEHGEVFGDVDLLDLARIRKAVSVARGQAQMAVLDRSGDAQAYAGRSDVADIATRGPITPDHVIRTKRVPVVVETKPATGVPEVQTFVGDYGRYYERNSTEGLQMLDPAPRAAIWRKAGAIAFGSNVKECAMVADIARHTRWAVQTGESLGGWHALPEKELFDIEYWSLEQAKLTKGNGFPKPHQGKVAVVTGAGSGIGRATCDALAEDGAVVVGLDLKPDVAESLASSGLLGIQCDLTDDTAVKAAIEQSVLAYGGIDIIVCNAGIFGAGETIEEMSDETWDQHVRINLTATQRFMTAAIPYLKHGVDPSLLVVGSRNFAAPGPGASAYSVTKAGVTQLARVAAMELAGDGIRVNVVHPDAVFDTELWTDEALEKSARRYGITVDEYKTRNLLKTEITSRDVGRLLSTMASDVFRATTGAQVPIDGGNERVI